MVDATSSEVMTGPRGSIVVTYRVYREDDQYVAECSELEVASCGGNIDEAFRMIGDAVELFLNSLEEEGECERFFTEHEISVIPDAILETTLEGKCVENVPARIGEYIQRQVVPLHILAYA